MAFSKEYTDWHLTPNGWVPGDSSTDSNKWFKAAPKDTVLSIQYSEKADSALIEKEQTRFNETKDVKLLIELESKFPFKPYIKVYEDHEL